MIKDFFSRENFSILSHVDLDGAVSAILFQHFFADKIQMVQYSGYDKIGINLQKIKFQSENILVLDLSLEQEDINFIDNWFDFKLIIDHHTSTLNQKIKFPSLINTYASGSMLSLYYLSEKLGYEIPKEFKALVKYTNDFDMFFLRHPESLILNNIFWKIGLFKFIEEYSNGLNENNWVGSKLYKIGLDQQKVIEDYINKCDKYEVEDVMVVAADDYISNIPLIIKEKENFIIIRKDLTISFRTKKLI